MNNRNHEEYQVHTRGERLVGTGRRLLQPWTICSMFVVFVSRKLFFAQTVFPRLSLFDVVISN